MAAPRPSWRCAPVSAASSASCSTPATCWLVDAAGVIRYVSPSAERVLGFQGERLDDEARRQLARVCVASARMEQLIRALLLLGQLTRRELSRRVVNVSAMAATVAAELLDTAPARQTQIIIAAGLRASADPNLLRVVLDNLLGNAWKYTAKRDPGRIELAVEQSDGEPALVVRDDGAGFDMTYAERLFRPFQRLHSSEEFEGTGIGLAMVERITRRHGGRIWADAAPGCGATFRFTLGPGAVSLG